MERHVGINELSELLSVSTLTLATTGRDGQPHAAPVYFAAKLTLPEDTSNAVDSSAFRAGTLHLYFFSDPNSQHGQDIAYNPQVAAALYPPCFDWQDIRGLQLRGTTAVVDQNEQWEPAWTLYQAKFPFVSALREIVARSTLYVLSPSWLRLVDNRRGFGFQQEWELV